MLKIIVRERVMDKEKKYFKETRKKVDIYFVIIISILSSLSVYIKLL